MSKERAGQMILDFQAVDAGPGEPENSSPELDIEGPKGKPGELWNGTIWASDDDLPF